MYVLQMMYYVTYNRIKKKNFAFFIAPGLKKYIWPEFLSSLMYINVYIWLNRLKLHWK